MNDGVETPAADIPRGRSWLARLAAVAALLVLLAGLALTAIGLFDTDLEVAASGPAARWYAYSTSPPGEDFEARNAWPPPCIGPTARME